jgi:hypothetical protein
MRKPISTQLQGLISHLHRDVLELRETVDAGFKSLAKLATKSDLRAIGEKLMTQTELTAALDAKTTQLVKVAKEQSDRFDKAENASREGQMAGEAFGVHGIERCNLPFANSY